MKFAESWLREHVAFDASRDELAARLTDIGLEVEDITVLGAALDGVVVAEIEACEKHPEADRLQVCRVRAGSEVVQIVCGAPNARAGLKAPLARVGAVLPGGIAIKAAKLRGVESFGMLCSAKELGIDADASGLLELPADAPVGSALADYLGLPDATIELKLTPNRADCFSVRGIAHDVAAATGSTVRPMAIDAVPVQSQAAIDVALSAGADCPRYAGRVVEGVNPAARTPLWMAERLRRSGLRPISPLVDITNYVMLELGQPMHAFDADRLVGPVGVRRARAGETLTLLDAREVALDGEFLLITDADRPVALAGVMGGFDTRVTDATTRVFLESAHFAPGAIAGRARRLGLHTDASHRFERGVDPQLPRRALERATALVLEIMGGQAGPVCEATLDAHLAAPSAVLLRAARLRRVLGIDVPGAEVERILAALGMQVQAVEGGWQVTPPSSRFDIAIEEDLIEEVVRIHGYDRVPLHAPAGQLALLPQPESVLPVDAVKARLVARDYQEAISLAFLDARTLAHWGLDAGALALRNPLSAELGVMRPSLLPGLVQAAQRNLARQTARVRLFEVGNVFAAEAPEQARIAALAVGPARAEQWSAKARAVDFHDLKGDLESLLALAGPQPALRFEAGAPGWLHPGRSATVRRAGEVIGWIGHLHPALLKALDLDSDVVVFELALDAVRARAVPRAGALSRFPSVRRDIAVVVGADTPWSALADSLRGALGAQLRDLVLFDQYTGPGLEAGARSLAIGLILQDVSRTLTDGDADAAVAAALAALQRDCNAHLRG